MAAGATETTQALINDPVGIVTVFLAVPAIIFYLAKETAAKKFFKIIPPLLFIYFLPTLLSTFGVIPMSTPIYRQIKIFVIPTTLVLLTMTVDVKAILQIGPKAILMFLAGTLGVFAGAPLAFFLFGSHLPENVWQGMAALAGSWIGGTGNFIAVGDAVGASQTTLGMMVVVDVLVADIWAAVLFYLAGKYKELDKKWGADNSSIEDLKDRIMKYQKDNERVPEIGDYLYILAIAFFVGWGCFEIAKIIPPMGKILSAGTYMVILCTTVGLALSFTPIRKLDGVGASKIGSVFIYILIGLIGAGANLAEIVKYPHLFAMGVVWMAVHAIIITLVMRVTKSPLFFMAVGSQANIGGTASAPIMASAFHPSLASVGVLMALCGTFVGTYVALAIAGILKIMATNGWYL